MALNLISSKRIKLDEALASLEGMHFFFSSITGIRLNATEKISKQKKKGKKRKVKLMMKMLLTIQLLKRKSSLISRLIQE